MAHLLAVGINMLKRCARIWIKILFLAASAWPAVAQDADISSLVKRYAIVIGNWEYQTAPDLGNANADAKLVAEFLADRGYQVYEYNNLGKLGFEKMMRRALQNVDKNSEVVFYYAGHGVQIAGGNYLLPVDAQLTNAYDVPFEAVSLSSVVSILGARSRLQMVILDSCRDNPFGNTLVVTDLRGGLSSVRDGFNTLTAPINSLLAFSTAPGEVAFDGDPGSNSPFTAAMIETARAEPDLPVPQIFERVRRLVYERTDGRQTPWESSTLIEDVSFQRPEIAFPPRDSLPSPESGLVRVTLDGRATGEIVLTGPLENELALAPALITALPEGPDAPIEITSRPVNGSLLKLDPYRRRLDAANGAMTRAELVNLVYASAISTSAAGEPESRSVADQFNFSSGGSDFAVDIELDADPCDAAAGDHLDPQGVGIALYPNEIEPDGALAACQDAVGRRPEVGRFHYQLGRANVALRHLDMARADFQKARDLGHIRAYYALGNLEANADAASSGKSDAPAPPAALDLYRQGVDLGDPFAFHALGKQLLRHGQTPAEREQGFDLLSRALELGHTFAMNELGTYFLDAESTDFDPARGLRYWQESAARGDIYGFNNMGFVYLNGLAGVEKNPQTAREWFERAASGGHPWAPGNLGRLWNSGALGNKDRDATAVLWYDRGLERGDGWSGANAAWIIAERGAPGLTKTDAAERAAKAAALGNAEAAASARELLASLPVSAVDGASQKLINALGGTIEADGAFGPTSVAEMARVLAAKNAEMPPADPTERAVALASIYWENTKFRVDVN